ncbi:MULTISPECIES: type I restriction endonuclease subunit R [Rhizobium/Agrobacterium group]|uniref:type I restriction endonuclease subunit R n=1 Tax=Rhizobium/Agrobacterium group TaxID=227290 RepID=UPI000B3FCAAF|nr:MULTISPECIES: type I restriction endonuclease subunit R [Rhizobium/Agrobacterium group]NSZ41594.1 type I restriction endonuclease subunit R [Agrobacterium vitis]NTA25277.1 type I restriction endonuclease subunit R [Allorhizobium ampelinum]OVE98115.1 DEAD/DEAH box helicase [Allorhizobium ampelinum]
MEDILYRQASTPPSGFSEGLVEEVVLGTLQDLGYVYQPSQVISPDGTTPARLAYGDVLLSEILSAAVGRLNPNVPADAREQAIRQLSITETPSLVEENRRIHRLITEGVDVEFSIGDGEVKGDKVWLIDFEHPEKNDFLVTNQFTVAEGKHTRRPDVMVFVNGLPLGIIELKNAASKTATIDQAYQQLQTYKEQIPSLFRTNAVMVASDGMLARIGSLTADEERFMPWRSVTGADGDFTPHGPYEMDTLLRGVFDKERFLALIRDFTVFGDRGEGPFKIIAGYHQFHGARKAITSAIEAVKPKGDRKIGVIWHTQGSGKSLLMAFLGGLIVRSRELENPTLIVLTDRNDLDDQLFGTFSLCKDLIRQTPEQADSRDDLRRLLNRASGGVIFTTVQKFTPEKGEEVFPILTERRNVIVMADEAHRSQYGFDAKLNRETGTRRYGYAHYIRQALPNASFMGFTGTPIEAADVNTPAIFGEYIDIYDISRAVEDGATVPIYYESRLARIELNEDEKPKIDAEIEAMLEDETLTEQEKQKAQWATVERLVGSKKRLAQIAADLVEHLEKRIEGLPGKAMAVCMSRRICVDLYKEIIALRPDWHSDDDDKGAVKIVMTGSASDPLEWQPHIGNKRRRDDLAKRARRVEDPLKLVIVRDMWLTGFDAPCMHTMYIDKPMRGHGLMQAIARVNRVFKEKPGGLVVDYIGIATNLKKALAQYSQSDRDKTGIDEEEAVALLLEKYEIVRGMFTGHDYSLGVTGKPVERLKALADGIDWVLKWQQAEAARVESPEAKKQAHRRYQDAVLELSKAYALASASDAATEIRDEVGFFQAVRAALVKTTATGKISDKAKSLAVEQLLNQAVANAEIVDILKAAGLQSPDISVLSDQFLMDVQKMEKKNLALEALKKLLNGEIKSRSKTNVVQSKTFSRRLEEAVARYHANAISTVEMIQELIALAKEMQAATARGDELGLSPEEIAFYDALAGNETAVEVMGSEQLRVIAHELVENMRGSVTVDWQHKASARAKMRILVKRILKRFGYPPDLEQEAVQMVLAQAELLLKEMSFSMGK